MKIVISPAKKLELQKTIPDFSYQTPLFLEQASQVIQVMRDKTPAEIKELMKLSDNLAQLNWTRYQNWKIDIDSTARPAIFTFNGNVYDGLNVYKISNEKLPQLNKKLRILSGLYGILRPFDLIYPYRMEMGAKLRFDTYKNLYDFWQPVITRQLNEEMKSGEVLVNLASQEYFRAIDLKLLKHPVVHIDFKEYKNGNLKTISIYAKIARGLMTRFIIENNIENPEELKLFNWENYAFDADLSEVHKFVFTR